MSLEKLKYSSVLIGFSRDGIDFDSLKGGVLFFSHGRKISSLDSSWGFDSRFESLANENPNRRSDFTIRPFIGKFLQSPVEKSVEAHHDGDTFFAPSLPISPSVLSHSHNIYAE